MEETKDEKPITFSVKPTKLWQSISGVLVILLIASVATGGFGFGGNPASPGLPTGAGTAGDDTKVKVSVDDDPSLGNEKAKVTIIEFSDFQCPFCRRAYTETLPKIKSQYIDTEKIKYVYRDFPLSFHPGAQPAAEGAECAEDQGKFWQMHDKVFDKQNEQGQGTIQFGVEDIKNWAKEVEGLDYNTWEQCLDSGKYSSEVQKDVADGNAAGVSGTPTFFIGNDKVGYTRLVGAQPFEAFQQVIDSLL